MKDLFLKDSLERSQMNNDTHSMGSVQIYFEQKDRPYLESICFNIYLEILLKN